MLAGSPELRDSLARSASLERLNLERHGAIRLGTAAELATMRRVFAVMGMEPVGYYDLSVAGIPVHSTAFRPWATRRWRPIPSACSPRCCDWNCSKTRRWPPRRARSCNGATSSRARALALTEQFERDGGLDSAQADEFVEQVRETFRWHSEATVTAETHQAPARRPSPDRRRGLFRRPAHQPPDPAHAGHRRCRPPCRAAASPAKEVVEGPPRRKHPILLRQTSFKALEEPVRFLGADTAGTHTARFGEVEQRGIALTRRAASA